MADISQIGILTPVLWEDGHNSGKSLLKFFQKADELGFGSIWVPDRLISNGPAFPSPVVLRSMAAAVTTYYYTVKVNELCIFIDDSDR